MVDVLLFSCGIDSLSAWFFMKKPKCIYMDLNTPYSKKEMVTIKKLENLIPDLKVEIIKGINLGQFEKGDKAFISNRNLILAAIACNYGNRIIIGGIEDDCVEDKCPKAFNAMSLCLETIAKKPSPIIEVYSPFWSVSKSEIIQWMLEHVENVKQILRTSVSCYSEDLGQCGDCPSCLRKAVAFEACGLNLDFFKKDVTRCSLIIQYIKDMKAGNYTEKRTKETLAVFKKWGWPI